MNTIKRLWALCLGTHMKLALYKYTIIVIIIIIIYTIQVQIQIRQSNTNISSCRFSNTNICVFKYKCVCKIHIMLVDSLPGPSLKSLLAPEFTDPEVQTRPWPGKDAVCCSVVGWGWDGNGRRQHTISQPNHAIGIYLETHNKKVVRIWGLFFIKW